MEHAATPGQRTESLDDASADDSVTTVTDLIDAIHRNEFLAEWTRRHPTRSSGPAAGLASQQDAPRKN